MNPFQFTGTPNIRFGSGAIDKLAEALPDSARRILFVMGSFPRTNGEHWERIVTSLKAKQIAFESVHIHREPDATWVDDVVRQYRNEAIDAVVAIGGGSAIDAGKAISAMLRTQPDDTVLHYLERMPDYRPHSGDKVFFIAVPTTTGTGSEATKNAVIAVPGGFKRSIRHDRFIPDVAIVDGRLTVSCPPNVKAASGLDALTQLIESFVSTNASPFTDALALSGIEAAARSLLPICTGDAEESEWIALHEHMAYASLLSGLTLAHAGLGLVHGYAAPLGGVFPIPHGVICGTLLAEVTKVHIERMRQEQTPAASLGLKKYAKIGALITGHPEHDPEGCQDRLIEVLGHWTEILNIPRLGDYGVRPDNIEPIVLDADDKQSPVRLEQQTKREILLSRI